MCTSLTIREDRMLESCTIQSAYLHKINLRLNVVKKIKQVNLKNTVNIYFAFAVSAMHAMLPPRFIGSVIC